MHPSIISTAYPLKVIIKLEPITADFGRGARYDLGSIYHQPAKYANSTHKGFKSLTQHTKVFD